MNKTYIVKRTDKLSEAQLKEIHEAKKKPQVQDEDCPVYDYDKLSSMLDRTRESPVRSRLGM